MATVRISVALKDAVYGRINRLESEGMDMAWKPLSQPDNAFITSLLDRLYPAELKAQLHALPDEFKMRINVLRLRVSANGRFFAYDLDGIPHDIYMPLKRMDFYPLGYTIYSGANSYSLSPEARLEVLSHDAVPEPIENDVYADVRKLAETCSDKALRNMAQFEAVRDAVHKVLSAHTTLAPALKVMPTLWELLPDEIKDRHKQITERKKTKETVELDEDVMRKATAALTAVKLSGR